MSCWCPSVLWLTVEYIDHITLVKVTLTSPLTILFIEIYVTGMSHHLFLLYSLLCVPVLQPLMGTCLGTCLEWSYASTVQWPGICLAWAMNRTFILSFSMEIHFWIVATAQTSSASSQPLLQQLRWSQRRVESGSCLAKLMTTCWVGNLTFNPCVTFDLYSTLCSETGTAVLCC